MYKFSYFTEEDPDRVLAFMKENSFAVITGFGGQYPVATHIPLAIEQKDDGSLFFYGHLMKKTDHHKAFEQNDHVLVVFNGPHSYVSASWYADQLVGSTWNYMTVHAKGRIKFTDEECTYHAIRAVTNKYEGLESEAAFDKLPKEYITKMLKAIVGFSIEVVSIDNVFKLSQNHDYADKNNIIKHLMERGDAHSVGIANEMGKLHT